MREGVLSGRRGNFFQTENRFIDCYAKKVGGNGVAVYSILQRCANSETKETWISACKMAEVLAIDKSTVYRHLKQLEDLRLIRSMRTREKTIYVVLPVPPPHPEAGLTPLFDAVDPEVPHQDSTWPPVAIAGTSPISEINSHQYYSSVACMPQPVSSAQHVSRTGENHNKEEQDLLNKTYEQENSLEKECAERLLKILGLKATLMGSVMAAVEVEVNHRGGSTDMVVERLATAVRLGERRGVSAEKFFENFLARTYAEDVVESLTLPATNALISTIAESVKAEAKYKMCLVGEAAQFIVKAALDDRERGVPIDKFYFENTRWRNANGSGQAKGTAKRNLDAALDARAAARRALGLDH